MNLRLDSKHLDGRAPDWAFNALAITIGRLAEGTQWSGDPHRILPGNPEKSLIYRRMNCRDPGIGRGPAQRRLIGSFTSPRAKTEATHSD